MPHSILRPLTAAAWSVALVAGVAGCANTAGSSGTGGPAAASPAPAPSGARPPVMQIYGNEGSVAPYTLFLGTPANFSTPVPKNGTGALDAGAIKVEPTRVGDMHGMKFTWTGGPGQFHLQSKTANDLLDYIDADAAMVFDAVVHKAPDGQVTMRVDCRYPCLGVVDMTGFYRSAPIGQKVQVKVPLSCYEATGTKFTVVDTPLVIFTTKPFALSVANVRYVPGNAKDADAMKCGGV
jgi:beta-glucosidase